LPTAKDGTTQIVYYHEGVGTSQTDEGDKTSYTQGITGDGLEAHVRALYRFIIYNYDEGDELYFFGFSRGAFTVRTLAGFMNYMGLIEKDGDYYVPEIYACYDNRIGADSPEWRKAFRNIKRRRACPQVKFIGVWDTVRAVDISSYHDIQLNKHILNAFQALAIDERRVDFKPEFWNRPEGWQGQLEQAWFAGAHANVGGCYNPDGLANEALHWLVEKAEDVGLEFDKDYLTFFRPCFDSWLNDEFKGLISWRGELIRAPGLHLKHGETVHPSVIDRMGLAESDYCPDSDLNQVRQVKYEPLNLMTMLDKLPIAKSRRTTPGQPCGLWRLDE
jgi:uncharacterized protein (DUF2235 family)